MVGLLKCLSVNGAPSGMVLSGVLRQGEGLLPEASFDGCVLATLLPLFKNS